MAYHPYVGDIFLTSNFGNLLDIDSAMDLYGDNFKLQDMLDSDIRSHLDILLTSTGDVAAEQSDHQPTLTDLAPAAPLESLESLDMENELGGMAGSTWLSHGSQLFNLGPDFDIPGGLLVNPQTGVPIAMPQPPTAVPASTRENQTVTSGQTTQISDTRPQLITTTPFSSPQHINHLDLQPAQSHSFLEESSSRPEVVSSPKCKQKPSKIGKSTVQQNNGEKCFPKPAFSYSCLIAMALKNSRTGNLPVNEIYNFMIENFPYFKTAPHGWKNSVRHNLSLNKCFEKIEKPVSNDKNQRKGCLWAMNPAKINKMDEEVQKWTRKDPVAIRRSMANPERLELLEKGQMKDLYPGESPDEATPTSSPSDQATEITNSSEVSTATKTADLPSLESLDPSLSELDLQKGIWENLGDDRLQLLVDSRNVSPLALHPSNQTVGLGVEGTTLPAFTCASHVFTQTGGSASYSLHCPYPNPIGDNQGATTNGR
ncbi:uncharacterized protein LOC143248748 isoform X1 [Tachypleus tridentatus]|uniref:uncharacterized protein LOC143248748 isoform X1 n=2 Tax=Tachypleus tridentatus TaxID=6853 RepID=UPI003FD3ABF1